MGGGGVFKDFFGRGSLRLIGGLRFWVLMNLNLQILDIRPTSPLRNMLVLLPSYGPLGTPSGYQLDLSTLLPRSDGHWGHVDVGPLPTLTPCPWHDDDRSGVSLAKWWSLTLAGFLPCY